jgi:hypothetical protein
MLISFSSWNMCGEVPVSIQYKVVLSVWSAAIFAISFTKYCQVSNIHKFHKQYKFYTLLSKHIVSLTRRPDGYAFR